MAASLALKILRPKQPASSSAVSALAPSPVSAWFLAPLPLASNVSAPRACLGFLIHPKVGFASGLLHLFPLPGILFLLQGSV